MNKPKDDNAERATTEKDLEVSKETLKDLEVGAEDAGDIAGGSMAGAVQRGACHTQGLGC